MLAKRCAVIGDPAGHSLSPAIHRAGYAQHQLDWSYEALTVAAQDLDSFLAAVIRDESWAGLSVTAPHKEAILAHGDADHVATLVGAGNTMVFGDTRPQIFNTDVPGFVRAWHALHLPPPSSAVLVGNGATARSLLVALAGLEVRQVSVLARTPARAARLLELGTALGIRTEVQPLSYRPADVDVVANTIPTAATAEHAAGWAESAEVLFDAVYHPWPTPLMAQATDQHKIISGLHLLAGQAVDQFELFTGRSLSFDDAFTAAERELRSRNGVEE